MTLQDFIDYVNDNVSKEHKQYEIGRITLNYPLKNEIKVEYSTDNIKDKNINFISIFDENLELGEVDANS